VIGVVVVTHGQLATELPVRDDDDADHLSILP